MPSMGVAVVWLGGVALAAAAAGAHTAPDFIGIAAVITAGGTFLLGVLAWLDRRANAQHKTRVIVIEDGKVVSDGEDDAS